MDQENRSGRLTPRAAELLASLMEEMREEILESASRRGVGLEISARDVIEAFEERSGDSRQYYAALARRRGRVQLLLWVYAAIAGALAAGAIFFSGSSDLSSEWTTALSAMSVGLVGASLALLTVNRRREQLVSERLRQETRRQGGFSAFMDRWLRIESLLRLLVAQDLGTSAGEMPLSTVLDASLRSGRISNAAHEDLRRLLAIRNEAVHGGDVSQEALVAAVQSADRLVRRFEEELAR